MFLRAGPLLGACLQLGLLLLRRMWFLQHRRRWTLFHGPVSTWLKHLWLLQLMERFIRRDVDYGLCSSRLRRLRRRTRLGLRLRCCLLDADLSVLQPLREGPERFRLPRSITGRRRRRLRRGIALRLCQLLLQSRELGGKLLTLRLRGAQLGRGVANLALRAVSLLARSFQKVQQAVALQHQRVA